MPTRRSFLTASLVASAVLTAGSAAGHADTGPPGDIPDNQAFVTYRGQGYSLKTPEGWGRTARGSVVTFRDKFNSIRIETAASATKPTVASVKQHDVHSLRTAAKGFSLRSVTRVTRPAGPAILMTYRAASAPDAVTGKSITEDIERYSFWKGGRVAVVTLAAPKGSDNVDAWKLITTSFRWTR
jgi:hypothetical protein